MIARGLERRLSFALAVLAAATLAAFLTASPAHAQTLVTTTSTFTLRNGDSVTLVQTYTDGVLSTTSYTEVSPTGLVVIDRDITYYSNGQMSSFTEVRNSMGGAYQTTTSNQYDENGVLREQYVKIISDGQTIAEQFSTYDAGGYLVTQETRIVATLADGTQVWDVTDETWSSGVLVSSTTTEYPYGYDFNAPPVAEEPTPVVEEPVAEEPAPVVEEPVAEEPTPVVEEPVAEEPAPVVEEPVAEEPAPVVEEPVATVPAPVIQEPVADEPVPVIEEPVADGPPVVEEAPVVEEPPVADEPPPAVETPPTRPGEGNGDSVHVHSGVAGQDGEDERPGNGNGDTHHGHSGPPGKNKAD